MNPKKQEALEALRLIRIDEVIRLTGLKSRVDIASRVKKGEFPRPLKIGPRAIAWHESEIRRWIESRPLAG